METLVRVLSTEPGRFWTSLVLTGIGFGVFFALLRRPKSELPTTWAQAMLASAGVFAMFLLCYGVVPHEWLTWADSNLGLREDRILLDTYAVDISGRALRDVVATMIYIVFLGANVAMWVMWQQRGTKKPKAEPAPAPVRTSAFSRPVAKKD
ncbi:MAG: hypothetical protein ACRDY7_00805 [Acidimicrobiia bacterium]